MVESKLLKSAKDTGTDLSDSTLDETVVENTQTFTGGPSNTPVSPNVLVVTESDDIVLYCMYFIDCKGQT